MKKSKEVLYTEKYTEYLTKMPVKKNTVFYMAYRNKIMSGNPFAIFQYLIETKGYEQYVHYWVYEQDEWLDYDTFNRYKDHPRVKLIKAFSDEFFEALATCEYFINNAALPPYWQKRKGQIYVNTWHGTPLKSLGYEANDYKETAVSNAQRNFLHCDFFVLQNKYMIDTMLDSYSVRGMMRGKILDMGYPRTDLVINADRDKVRTRIENKTGISLKGKKILLYAPTFRSENGTSIDNTKETIKYINELSEKIPDDHEILFKVHNTMGEYFKNNAFVDNRLIFDEFETNELLAVTDILITDYSSIFFDYLCTGRPILFFTYDYDEYKRDRGMYLDLDQLPGQLCFSIDDLIRSIIDIDTNGFSIDEKYRSFQERFAYNDDGLSSKRVVETVFDESKEYDDHIISSWDGKETILVELGTGKNYINLLKFFSMIQEDVFSEKRVLLSCNQYRDILRYITFSDVDVRVIGSRLVENSTIKEKSIYSKKNTEIPEDYLRRQRQKFFADLNIGKMYKINKKDTILSKLFDTEIVETDSPFCIDRPVFLFLATYDSMNAVLAPLIEAAQNNGCYTITLSYDKTDKNSCKVLDDFNINYVPVTGYNTDQLDRLLDLTDVVIASPVKVNTQETIWKRIRRKDKIVVSFATLFSSVTMRNYSDFVFCIGESKIEEFRKNFLDYNFVVSGNPQYDKLIKERKDKIGQESIKRVLIIDQGAYPYGSRGKTELANTYTSIARLNPEKSFTIKPRYISSQIGHKVHNVSEYIQDYLIDMPENLSVIDDIVNLERILPDYDAVITTWSTAYMDAMVINMPMILISGLESKDVYDVRKQRVEEAYQKLEKTGCLWDYKTLQQERVEFKYADDNYASAEICNLTKACSSDLVEALVLIKKYLADKDQRVLFSADHADITDLTAFEEYLKNAETKSVNDPEYMIKKKYLVRLNLWMQRYVYEYRCLGFDPDLSSLRKYYDLSLIEFDPNTINKFFYETDIWADKNALSYYHECVDPLIESIRDEYRKIMEMYFSGIEMKDEWGDEILQSYYFKWLYENCCFEKLANYTGTLLAESSYNYYLARTYHDLNDTDNAMRSLAAFLRNVLDKNGFAKLFIERKLEDSLAPFRDTKKDKIKFYRMIKKEKLEGILIYLEGADLQRNSIIVYNVLKELYARGDIKRADQIYNDYITVFEGQKKKARRLTRKVSFAYKSFLTKRIKKLYSDNHSKGDLT